MEQGGTLYRIPNYSIEKNNMNCQAMLSLYALSAYLLFDDKLEYIVMLLSNTVYCPTHYLISGLRETGLSFEGLYMGMPFHPQVYCKVYAPVIFNYLVESLLCARQRANVLVKAIFECKGWNFTKISSKRARREVEGSLYGEGQEAEGTWATWDNWTRTVTLGWGVGLHHLSHGGFAYSFSPLASFVCCLSC